MMQTIGNYLKSGREARNIKLSDVAHSTKISKWYLDCLEKDEYDKIPGGPYIKGYITSYASYIGIEEEEILKRYNSLQIDDVEETESQDHLPQKKKKQTVSAFFSGKKKTLVLSMAALILLALGFNHFYFADRINNGTHSASEQDSKSQPPLSATNKKTASSSLSDENSISSAKSAGYKGNERNIFTQKQEFIHSSNPSVLTMPNLTDPIINTEGSPSETQPVPVLKSLALFPAEPEVIEAPQTVFSVKKNIQAAKPSPPGPVINEQLSSSEKIGGKHAAQAFAKNTARQVPSIASDSGSGSVSGYKTPVARTQPINNLKVMQAVASSGVIDRNPAGIDNTFNWSTERVYIWSMIECKQPPSSIRHTYYFKGQKVNDIVLKIKSPQWRTWSYKSLLNKRYIGQWKVDITSIEGELLQRIFFNVN